jgi:hypothetical protein
MPGVCLASLTNTSIDWSLFNSTDGYIVPYTYNGQPVADEESSSDSTNGGAAVSPSSIDLASGSPNGSDPGTYDTPAYGYYNGGTIYNATDPDTMLDDYVYFRMRLDGDPRSGTQANKTDFASYHWNVLLDVDNDGYKEFWVDIDGGHASGTNQYDVLNILYDDSNQQDIADPVAARVEQFTAYNDDDANNYTHTRVWQTADGTGDWVIEIQVPIWAFTDASDNQVLFPNSPVGFVFTTGSSATDPLQKDFMTDLGFISNNDPINFGDVVKSNGEPDLYFANSSLEQVYSYTQGDNIYLYLRDAFANSDPAVVDTLTVSVSNPATGDDETVTMTESGPNTGIFSNLGGASGVTSSDSSTAWISYVKTSIIASDEDWTLTYDSAAGTWTVVGSVSGTQSTSATAGTEYTSDDGSITFTVYENGTPLNGATLTFSSYSGDQLTTSSTAGADDDGDLQIFSGQTISYSHTNDAGTFTDSVPVVGAGEPFIQFTRADGSPSNNFNLTADPGTSDKLYVTVYHYDSNTDSGTAQSISVSLSGSDAETITLTETGPDTGIFRNTTGLDTKVSDGTITSDDSLWEDVDSGVVTATFNYSGTDYTTSATLFSIDGAGRVELTNGAGTEDVTQYASGDAVFFKVEDPTYTCTGTISATVSSTTGDSETVTLTETSSGSDVYMNRINDLSTYAGLAVVNSVSSGFITNGVSPDDTFIIATGPDAGTYTVSSVDSETKLTLASSLSNTRTDISFNAYPIMTAIYNGSSYTADDGVLDAAHGDTVTVTYTDCDDGDADSGNDNKTDTATFNAPQILINEVFFHPDEVDVGGSPDDYNEAEYVQIMNTSPSAINVTGYSIADGDGFTYTIPQHDGSDISLLAGEKLYITLVGKTDAGQIDTDTDYVVAYGSYYVHAMVSGFSNAVGPNNFNDPDTTDTADQITLYDSGSTAVDYVAWSTTSSNTEDFKGDDNDAVSAGIWQDNNYLDVSSIAKGQAITRAAEGVDSDQPSDWTFVASTVYEDYTITQAIVSFLEVTREDEMTVVRWETVSEIGTAGFHLMRLNEKTGKYKKVNNMLLPALVGEPLGGTYGLVDETDDGRGSVVYRLVEVENNGNSRTFGPYAFDFDDGDEGPDYGSGPEHSTDMYEEGEVVIIYLDDGTLFVTDDPYSIRNHSIKSTASGAVQIFDNAGTLVVTGSGNSDKRNVMEMIEGDGTTKLDVSSYTMSARLPRAAARGKDDGKDDEGKSHSSAGKGKDSGKKDLKSQDGSGVGKVFVKRDGLYYLGASGIAGALGISEGDAGRMIRNGDLWLSNMGQAVGYLSTGDDGVYFYGQAPDSVYTEDNVYWLGDGGGQKINAKTGKGPSVPEGTGTFTRTVHAEDDQYAPTVLFSDPDGDYWLWDFLVSGFTGWDKKSFPIDVPSPAAGAGDATVTVNLMGSTDTAAAYDHHAYVSMNGTYVGETWWDGTSPHSVSFVFGSELLLEGQNTVEVEGILDSGYTHSVFYVDSVEIEYESLYRAVDDSLFFTGDGNETVTVSGFSSADILVLEIGDTPHSPVVTEADAVQTDDGYGVSLSPSSPDALYLAITKSAAITDMELWPEEPSDLRNSANSADYLIIAPGDFQEEAGRLAEYRAGRGMAVAVVRLEDIMDEFNFGLSSPSAISEFLGLAHAEWAVAPKYVLLMGQGSYDYKDNLGFGESLIPPLMVETPDGLFPADGAYGDMDGDYLPEIAVGRLPASTQEEAAAMVEKIIAYEASSAEPWRKELLMLADLPDGGADFPDDSDEVAGEIPGDYSVTKVYLSEHDISEARSLALGTINGGVGFVNYFGHGGVERLSQQGLLTSSDATALENVSMPTVVTTMTCVVGHFAIPGYDSLGEALLLSEGGAVAVWAPSGMSVNSKAKILGTGFYQSAMDGGTLRLGDAILDAGNYYSGRSTHVYLLDIYNLLGDPALRLR